MPFGRTIAHTQPREGKQIEIRVARSIPEIEALRDPWVGWPGHRDSDIDFYLMIVQSYPEVVRPHVIALYRNGKPDAILVGRLERKQLTFGLGYISVFRPWCRCLTFVYAPIRGNASPANVNLLTQEILGCLKQDEADIAKLELVPVDSPLYHLALTVPGMLSRDNLTVPQGHDIMIIPDTIAEVYRRMSHGRRHETRRLVRKLQGHPAGTPRIACYRDTSDLDRLFRDAEEIARKTYQRGLGAGFADTPKARVRLGLAAQKGWLRGYVLYLGDRPCAFWIGMLYGEAFVGEYTGYDPEFRQASPGLVLLMHVIERLCTRADGHIVKEFEFGPGHAEYKAVLSSKYWLEAVVYIFSPTAKGLLLKVMHTITEVVNASARRILISTRLFLRLKRAWRDRLAKHAQTAVNAVND